MAGKVVNSSFVLLSKLGASRQESASKTSTSHIRNTLYINVKRQLTLKRHIWFLPTHSSTLKNQKSHFLPTHGQTNGQKK